MGGDGDKYEDIREKVIGQVLYLTPDPINVINDFALAKPSIFARIINFRPYRSLDSEFKDFVASEAHFIVDLFKFSNTSNMRLLIKSLRDFSRLYPLLHELIGSDVTKTKTVMATFMALSMAYNRGQEFDKSVLEQERSWDYAVWRANGASGEEPMKKPIDVLRETYAQLTAVRLDGLVISRDLAVAVISKGVFDASFVKSELEKSPYISRLTGDLWRILWSWRRSDASDVELALDGVLQSLLDFKIGNPIVLIHVFCILKDMEDAGVCLKLPKNVDESFSDYILSALERKILPTDVPKHQFRYSLSRMNDTGLGFCGEGSDFYERVITGLDDVLDQAFWIQIKEDPNHFVHELRSNALRLMWSLDDRGGSVETRPIMPIFPSWALRT